MRRFWHHNGLSITLLGLTIACLCGHLVSGYSSHLGEHTTGPALSIWDYAQSGSFLGSVFENWESEFLQMATYVLATVALFQRGSGDSKDPDGGEELVDADPADHRADPDAPWPVRKGGWISRIYASSLSIALVLAFLGSFVMHLLARRVVLGEQTGVRPDILDVLGDATFWFESFQNWQSEFLSILVLVVLSIFLRQRGSPESKPVHFPHSRTGRD